MERQPLIRPKELTGPISVIACSAPFGFELISGGGIRQDRRNDHPDRRGRRQRKRPDGRRLRAQKRGGIYRLGQAVRTGL